MIQNDFKPQACITQLPLYLRVFKIIQTKYLIKKKKKTHFPQNIWDCKDALKSKKETMMILYNF